MIDIKPGKRVPGIARSKVGTKKEVRLRRGFWKNHGELSLCYNYVVDLKDKKERISVFVFSFVWILDEEESSGIYTW